MLKVIGVSQPSDLRRCEVQTGWYVPLIVRLQPVHPDATTEWYWSTGYLDDNIIEMAFSASDELLYIKCVSLIRCPHCTFGRDAMSYPIRESLVVERPSNLRGATGQMGLLSLKETARLCCGLVDDTIHVGWHAEERQNLRSISVGTRLMLILGEDESIVGMIVTGLSAYEKAELQEYFVRHE